MEETEILEEESSQENEDTQLTESLLPIEDLMYKNTKSFQCLAQIEISRSSIFRDPLYNFPDIDDPKLDQILWEIEKPPEYDNIGIQRYKDLCKTLGIVPYRRVIQSLDTEYLDLKFYGLGEKSMHAICETLQFNEFVKQLSFQENWLTPEALKHVASLIEKSKIITILDLKQCNIGFYGSLSLDKCFISNEILRELDLSHNNLGNNGIEILAYVIKDNHSIKKLNLSFNCIGDRGLFAVRVLVEENYTITDLDLSWNYIFSPVGLQQLMEGLTYNISITSLNLSFNGIGEEQGFKFILLYLKSEDNRLQHLDLSYNRITGPAARMLKTGLKSIGTLITLNLAYNPLTPDEVVSISRVFLDFPSNLNFIDFGETFVNKNFILIRNKIRRKNCNVKIGGILSNYKIQGPNIKEVLLNRCKFAAMHPKKKKFAKDFGQFILQIEDDQRVTKEEFVDMIKTRKIKLDNDLLEMTAQYFTDDSKKVDLPQMKEFYLRMYPDTQPAPPKKKKGKK